MRLATCHAVHAVHAVHAMHSEFEVCTHFGGCASLTRMVESQSRALSKRAGKLPPLEAMHARRYRTALALFLAVDASCCCRYLACLAKMLSAKWSRVSVSASLCG